MKKKYIFFDIDGTLTSCSHKGEIPASTKEALRKLQTNGHFVALATGRAHFRAMEFAKEIGIGNLTCEGGNALVLNYELVAYEYPDQELAKKIIKGAWLQHIPFAVSVEDSRIRYAVDEQFSNHVGDISEFMEVQIQSDMKIDELKGIRRIFLAVTEEKEEAILPYMQAFGAMRYRDHPMLILEPDDKYKGIRQLVAQAGGSEEDIVVFGDGRNDRKMFQHAPLSIAMGNAEHELKRMADYVTDASDADGIFNACLHFGWI